MAESLKRKKKARRAKGEGGLYQRADGYWEAALDLGYDFTGKRLRKRITGRTQSDVLAKMRQAQQDKDAGTLILTSERLSVAQYMNNWLTAYAQLRVRPSTYESYEAIIRRHVVPTIGSICLTKLRADQVQSLYAAKLHEGLSPRRVQYIHAVLRMAMKQAVENGLLNRNPLIGAKPPRVQQKETLTFTPDQARQFIEFVSADRMAALYVLAITTGMRRGELVGLQWSDINWEQGTLTVNRGLVPVKGKVIISQPKTVQSKRTIVLPDKALDILMVHKLAQDQEKDLAGDDYRDNGWVFCHPDGTWLRPEWVTHHLTNLLSQTYLPKLRVHDLRHTHATLLLLDGVHIKVVQERLGHSTPGFTLARYIHTQPGMQMQAVHSVNKLIHS